MTQLLKYLWRDYKEAMATLCRISKRSKLYLTIDMLWCMVFRLTTPSDYRDFGFDFIPRSKRKDYFTLAKKKYTWRKLTARSSRIITINKFYFASIMRPFMGRKFLHSLDMTMEDFLEFIDGEEKFILKPITGSGGHGHVVYKLDGSRTPEEMFNDIKTRPAGILEGWIHQHEALNALYPDAVHIARLHTIHDGTAKDICIYGANFSIAFQGEIANTCLDTSLSAQVDNETGILTSPGYDPNFAILEKVPGSGITIKGFQLPDWDKALDMCRRAAARVPEIQLIGWDVAFTPDGPVIVEGNSMPGTVGIQSRCWVDTGLTYGIWPLIKPYVKQKSRRKR